MHIGPQDLRTLQQVSSLSPAASIQVAPSTSSSDISMAPLALKLAFHALGFASCFTAFSELQTVSAVSGVDIEDEFGGHWQFLTNIGLTFTGISFFLSILLDLAPHVKALRSAKLFFATPALPAEFLIAALYWTLLSISPDLLIMPVKKEDPLNPGVFIEHSVRLPLWLDLRLHAFPGVLMLIDYYAFSPSWSKNTHALFVGGLPTLIYVSWATVCAHFNGHYPYPLLTEASPTGRVGIYAGSLAVMISLTVFFRESHVWLDKALHTGVAGSGAGSSRGKVDLKGKKKAL
ncbi:hypothetical protein OC846_001273 [Tilletia horrida]|uniref:FAR-17a/AIG1-like protein n=1 Tax=Tilletia horrida TaxID=155126 RepID=A0AAN6JU01_9BASI|nr:hypothetical protein OC845_000748 [Tilletia horrida]KAK0556318.1 hypothetical protein OC846_001273 [Tilletia horrida]KAK0569425.1 hypothetical protein OC861_000913 [Tilletia horrida]